MSNFENIIVELNEPLGIVLVYLNRPTQLNALIYELAKELCIALEEISKNELLRCLILTGKGKAFCSGGDIIGFKEAEDPRKHIDQLVSELEKVIRILNDLNIPSIAAVNGACFGAGLGLACACDFRICSKDAKFGSAFTGVGLSPDSSTTFFLPRIVGLSLAKEMIIINKILNSEEAKKSNLVSQIYSKESLLEEARKMALKMKSFAPIATRYAKELLIQSFSNTLEQHLEEEKRRVITTASTDDFQEGIRAFLERRKPDYKGK